MFIKELQKEDIALYSDFFATLANLTHAPEMTAGQTAEVLHDVNDRDGHVFIAIEDGNIICSVTLLVERKFIRNGALCGHIEDVVTHSSQQKKGLATSVIKHALDYAEQRGCYKVVLYCKEELVPFYSKNGFATKGINMEVRYPHHL